MHALTANSTVDVGIRANIKVNMCVILQSSIESHAGAELHNVTVISSIQFALQEIMDRHNQGIIIVIYGDKLSFIALSITSCSISVIEQYDYRQTCATKSAIYKQLRALMFLRHYKSATRVRI